MQRIELEAGGTVDVRLHGLDRVEVTCDIEHHPAIGESGGILDRDGGDTPSVAVAGDELRKGLDAIEQAGGIGAGDGDGCRVRREAVGLCRAARRDGQRDCGSRSRGP